MKLAYIWRSIPRIVAALLVCCVAPTAFAQTGYYIWDTTASVWTPTKGCGTNIPQTLEFKCLYGGYEERPDYECSHLGPKPDPRTREVELFNSCTFSWKTGSWSAWSSNCSATAKRTRNVWCERSDGTEADSPSKCTGTKPATSQTQERYSGCTYSWTTGNWSSCTGGSGTWQYSSWSPSSGCGEVEQSRTATCQANSNSGSRTRAITCLRSDGTTVSNSTCQDKLGNPPATSQACTPTSGFSCGTKGSTTRTVTLTNTCSWAWKTSSWSSWSSTCSDNATRTRSVWCERSDGYHDPVTTNCSGSKPATSQTAEVTTGCSYTWETSSWGSCTGGAGTWQYTAWSPVSGCGDVTQTRDATCEANANSGSQSRTVVCRRSDGTIDSNSECQNALGDPPATTQTCTPTSGFSCGTKGPTSQTVTLTDTCSYTWKTSSWSAWSSTCSTNATRTRSVWCERSDGTPETSNPSLCGPSKPAESETAEVDTGCSYSWDVKDWGVCSGGTAHWNPTEWLPASGCGMTTQTRTAECVADDDSATQTREVTCLRSDGTTAPESECIENGAGDKPDTDQACTPTEGYSCGAEPPLSQEVELTDTCTYSWFAGEWGPWSSDCSETATRTRDVYCRRSDGAVAGDHACRGLPDPEPAEEETAEVTTGCEYTWVASGFGECTGGTYSWFEGEWGPTMACGEITQTRTVTCAVDVNSGSHSQTVTCLRSDGKTVEPFWCPGDGPATVEDCTPGQEICENRPPDSRIVTLDTSCVRDAILDICASRGEDQLCVVTPLK